MSNMVWEWMENWKQLQDSDGRQANVHLMLLLRYVFETRGKADLPELDRLRFQLEESIEGRLPEDWSSYNLGMAQVLQYMLHHDVIAKQQQFTFKALAPLEKKVIDFLAHHPKSTPTELAGGLELSSRQQISNLLRSLRSKKLIEYLEIGKNRWYSLSQIGELAHAAHQAQDELSVLKSADTFAEIEEPAAQELKRKQSKNAEPEKHESKFEEFAELSSGNIVELQSFEPRTHKGKHGSVRRGKKPGKFDVNDTNQKPLAVLGI
ncbi:winged helix-turn-helix domain-containing protein [Paenibacillus thalictri]|uniref:ArsR family transcriptional regulator n=1 Tax=Paenibacillus thalictri TaxID=2527873 RepID=A0A4Q9DF84_9BACL|nr:winged helix-turn-helix domain-containing protein [Paenibacillus thalictri]TBL70549.1 ArsR family transcriptional regulator [Paenibacillus thalictri]